MVFGAQVLDLGHQKTAWSFTKEENDILGVFVLMINVCPTFLQVGVLHQLLLFGRATFVKVCVFD